MKETVKLPESLAHLEPYKDKCQLLRKGIYAFYIPQWEPGSNETRQEWLDFRNNFISSSDIGSVLGLNKFEPAAKLFRKKLGEKFEFKGSKFSLYGHEMESIVAKFWTYWDGESEDSWADNYLNNNPQRKCRAINAIIVNEKYPWLSSSIDYTANGGQVNRITGEIMDKPFPLEIKTMTYSASQQYENGFAPSYIAQVMEQMIVFESDYAESATLVDRDLMVNYWELTDEWRDRILTESKEFWDKVLEGRELYQNLYLMEGEMKERAIAILNQLEPEPGMSPKYAEMLKERYRLDNGLTKEFDSVEEQDEYVKWLVQYDDAAKDEKEAKDRKQEATNNIKKIHAEYEVVDFMPMGKSTWRRTEGKRDYFKITCKVKR